MKSYFCATEGLQYGENSCTCIDLDLARNSLQGGGLFQNLTFKNDNAHIYVKFFFYEIRGVIFS